MPARPVRKPRKNAAAPSAPSRQRVRRGNADDAADLRRELLAAAETLFSEGGLEGVSVRKVAARVGVSAMTPYRYFADKAELLVGLWEFVMQGLLARMQEAVLVDVDPALRVRSVADAFLAYWEEHPDRYRLVYMAERTTQRQEKSDFTARFVYSEILELAHDVTQDYAESLGADPRHVGTASDLRFTMLIGYLHTTLIVKRYPWNDPVTLRKAFLDQLMTTVRHCLVHGPVNEAPTARNRRA